MKQEAAREAAQTAFLLMLGIPVLMFKDHFGQLMRREEKFIEGIPKSEVRIMFRLYDLAYPNKMRMPLGMELKNKGVDIGTIQEIMGHADS